MGPNFVADPVFDVIILQVAFWAVLVRTYVRSKIFEYMSSDNVISFLSHAGQALNLLPCHVLRDTPRAEDVAVRTLESIV